MDDKYDHAIDYLNRHPEEIREAWLSPYVHPGGCLFQFVRRNDCDWTKQYGCLTSIRCTRGEVYCAETPELTVAIAADTRLPTCASDIRLHHLPVFAEWQRRIDRELGRV